ncbi:MAG TPA: hypothetical protein VL947_08665 [Cytophagales bacterium]|nr:hypothetical protein [Cytophagales bacterium]
MRNKLVLKYSLVSAFGACTLLFISAYASVNRGADFEDYTSIIIMTSFVLLLLELRNRLPLVPFFIAFKSTFLVSIITIMASSFVFYYIVKYYNRNVLDMYKVMFYDMIDHMDFSGETKEVQKNQVSAYGPVLFTIAFVVGGFIKYLFWSCMISMFLKKDKVDNPDEQY